MLVSHPKRLALVDGKCKQPEEIGLPKPASPANRTMSKVAAQNVGEAALSNH